LLAEVNIAVVQNPGYFLNPKIAAGPCKMMQIAACCTWIRDGFTPLPSFARRSSKVLGELPGSPETSQI